MRSIVRSILTLFFGLALVGCAGGGETSQGPREVEVMIMKDSGVGHFHTPVLEISAGDTVNWENMSGFPHNVVFDNDSLIDSPIFNDGERFSMTFPKPGTYRYLCTLHPLMTGVVEVR